MPIKPENAKRYPRDWKQIRARILARAGNRCEGSPAYPDCRAPNGWLRNNTTGEITDNGLQTIRKTTTRRKRNATHRRRT